MSDLPVFTDRTAPPAAAALDRVLGPFAGAWARLLAVPAGYDRDWKFPGRKHGWLVKVERKRKALFWLTPLECGCKIGFMIRAAEQAPLLACTVEPELARAIAEATRYPEGLGFFLILRAPDIGPAMEKLIRDIIALRDRT